MNPVVVFNYQNWLALYSEFANTTTALSAQNFFNIATTICANDGSIPIPDSPPGNAVQTLTTLLYTLTAHIAKLLTPDNTGQTNGLVGRIASAGQGSVNVQTEFAAQSKSQLKAWLSQTQYGAMYMVMIRPYQLGRFVAPRNRGVQIMGSGPGYRGLGF